MPAALCHRVWFRRVKVIGTGIFPILSLIDANVIIIRVVSVVIFKNIVKHTRVGAVAIEQFSAHSRVR